MTVTVVEADRNLTIPYRQGIRPYHTCVAELVRRHATAGHGRLLDFGCGVGNTLVEIERLRPGLEFVIADVDQRCLAATQKKVGVARSYLMRDGRDRRALEGTFDITLLSHVLHYDEDPLGTARAVIGCLRPSGLLILASPNPTTPLNIVQHVLRRRRSQAVYMWDRPALRNFVALLEGMEALEETEDFVPLPLFHARPAFDAPQVALARLLPWLAFSMIHVLRKA